MDAKLSVASFEGRSKAPHSSTRLTKQWKRSAPGLIPLCMSVFARVGCQRDRCSLHAGSTLPVSVSAPAPKSVFRLRHSSYCAGFNSCEQSAACYRAMTSLARTNHGVCVSNGSSVAGRTTELRKCFEVGFLTTFWCSCGSGSRSH